jgi:hypothetical protein
MKVFNGFLKLVSLLAICLAAGLIAIIYFSIRPENSDFWLRIILILLSHLIGSLACRMLFHRMLGVFLFLIAGHGSAGTSNHRLFLRRHLSLDLLIPQFCTDDACSGDIAQGILLLLVTLPLCSSRARKKLLRSRQNRIRSRTRSPARTSNPAGSQASGLIEPGVQPVLYNINPGNWQMTQDVGKQVKKVTGSAKKAVHSKSVRVNTDPGPVKAKQSPKAIKPAVKKTAAVKPASTTRKSRKAQNYDVKLMGEEEHVCPYCLEKVNKDDEKMICPECGTWHHKECWDLTGTCGVLTATSCEIIFYRGMHADISVTLVLPSGGTRRADMPTTW